MAADRGISPGPGGDTPHLPGPVPDVQLRPELRCAGLDRVRADGQGPYATRWATFRHLTAVDGIQALTKPVPMDTEMVLGGTGQTSGKITKTKTFFSGGQLVYARSHATGPGLLGTYGLIASPWSTSDQSSVSVTRSVVHDMNRKGFGHQVQVTGNAEHWMALTSSLLGSGAAGRRGVPDWLAAAAGG
ncbi:hypothetical protein NKH18_17400 [Streptomyces sp. M10(2022)]